MRFLVASGIACAAGASLTTTDTVVSESPRWLARVRRVTGRSFSGGRFKGRRSVASLIVGCQKGNCLVSSFYSRFLAGRPQGTENEAFRVLRSGERNVLVNRWTSRPCRFCVRTRRETAGPSTTLRSGRDDNSLGLLTAIRPTAFGPFPCNRIVIPTGVQRSGGTCGFSSGSLTQGLMRL
jgi:hypothetical protein